MRTGSQLDPSEELQEIQAKFRRIDVTGKGYIDWWDFLNHEASARLDELSDVSGAARSTPSPSYNLTEFNLIATPSPNYDDGNPGWHRTRKPVAYRVSCYTRRS